MGYQRPTATVCSPWPILPTADANPPRPPLEVRGGKPMWLKPALEAILQIRVIKAGPLRLVFVVRRLNFVKASSRSDTPLQRAGFVTLAGQKLGSRIHPGVQPSSPRMACGQGQKRRTRSLDNPSSIRAAKESSVISASATAAAARFDRLERHPRELCCTPDGPSGPHPQPPMHQRSPGPTSGPRRSPISSSSRVAKTSDSRISAIPSSSKAVRRAAANWVAALAKA